MSANLEAQVSAIAATVEELSRRVNELVVQEKATDDEDRVRALEETERNLRSAARRLDRLLRDLRRG